MFRNLNRIAKFVLVLSREIGGTVVGPVLYVTIVLVSSVCRLVTMYNNWVHCSLLAIGTDTFIPIYLIDILEKIFYDEVAPLRVCASVDKKAYHLV